MKLLNLCAGANRVQSEDWINLDQLFPVLPEGSPERCQLISESNYREFDVLSGPLPFDGGAFDGVLFAHALEHFDCQAGAAIMADCHRLLKPGGVLLVSVPDASYFRRVHDEDTVENAQRLFGEPIHLPDGETTFLGYGLFNRYHKAILTEDALWAYFVRAGFKNPIAFETDAILGRPKTPTKDPESGFAVLKEMMGLLNRLPFSLVMAGVKDTP